MSNIFYLAIIFLSACTNYHYAEMPNDPVKSEWIKKEEGEREDKTKFTPPAELQRGDQWKSKQKDFASPIEPHRRFHMQEKFTNP